MNKLIRHVVFLLALLSSITSPSWAQTYYVDVAGGNDQWTGALPTANIQLTNGPWKTIAKVNAQSFAPGDSVLFQCGETWREQLIVTSPGSKGKPVTFGQYGTSCSATSKPIINGAEIISGWSVYTGNIYVANVAFDVSQVVVDNDIKSLSLAHYPNSGYLTITADSKDTSGNHAFDHLTSTALDQIAAQDIVGATAHIRTMNWRIEDCPVSSFNGTNTVSWTTCPTNLHTATGTEYEIKKSWGYYLDNKLWMLDQPGEWFYDKAARKLYLWLPDSTNPATHQVEATRYNIVIFSASPQSIAINGLDIRNAGKTGVKMNTVQEFSLQNLDIYNSGETAILLSGDYQANTTVTRTIDQCNIQSSVRQGIVLSNLFNVTITNNTLADSGNIGMPKNSFAAIVAAPYATIKQNTIRRSGLNGIDFSRNNTIQNNIIEESCLVLNDCGIIYFWNGATPGTPTNSQIIGNIIDGATGNTDGTPSTTSWASGIYLDDSVNNVLVENNTVNGTQNGVYMNEPYYNTVRDNTIFGGKDAQIAMNEKFGNITPGTVHDNQILNNILFSLNKNPLLRLYSIFNNTINFGRFDANRYSPLFSDQIIEETNSNASPAVKLFSFSAWKNARYQEAGSSLSHPYSVLPYGVISSGQNLISNPSFDSTVLSWRSWDGSNTTRTDAIIWQGSCTSSGGCLKIQPSKLTSIGTTSAISNDFSLTQGKIYLVNFKLSALQANQSLQVNIQKGSAPYQVLGLAQKVVAGTGWKNYSYAFTANATLSNARLYIPITNKLNVDQTIYIDNVSVKEVTLANETPGDDAKILMNKSAASQLMSCPDSNIARCNGYIDLSGNPVNWPVTVGAYGSMIVLWANTPFRDTDHDLVLDSQDLCPNTTNLAEVDALGCAPGDVVAAP